MIAVRSKKSKVVLLPEFRQVKVFSWLTHPHSCMCIRIYIFCFKQTNKKKHTHRNKKQKKLRKIEKKKRNQKKKRINKMLLLTISLENLVEYNDIVWKIALCTFNLPDQPTKREHVLIKTYLVIKTFLFIYSIHLSFPTFNIIMIKFCTLKIVTSTLSKALSFYKS